MPRTLTVETLEPEIVAIAQCAAIDADAFPYPSAAFARRTRLDTVLVAREPDDAAVAGFVALRAGPHSLHVLGLAVRRDRRRRGVARALLRAALGHAERQGVERVVLCVSVANRSAITLYQSEGFETVERARGYYPPGAYDGERDALRMRWAPPPDDPPLP